MAGCFAFAACSDDSGNDSNPGTDQPGENPGDSTLIEEKPEWINKPGAVSFMAANRYQLWVYTFNVGDTLTVVDNEGNEWEVISEEITRERDDSTYICGFADVTMGASSNREKNEWTIKGNIKEMFVWPYVPNEGYTRNEISGIDISTCPYLEWFQCGGAVTSLVMGANEALAYLICNGDFASLNISGCPNLLSLYCSDNEQLTSLNISDCPNLIEVVCYRNRLTSLDISGCPNLVYLSCFENLLPSLNISGCLNLETLYCSSNQLTSLDISNCSNLIEIGCNNNRLTLLDVSNCPNLDSLSCGNNLLTELDVTKNVKLIGLICNNYVGFSAFNKLTSLDVSQNTELTTLGVYYNKLVSLDLSKNTKLTNVDCRLNNFTDETMNDIYNVLPEVGFDKYGEPMGELLCDEELGDKSIAEEKGWYVHD